ncbi:MAG: hypothetical protein K6B65_03295 [Bacilli bacterium]|nr:hypothetical protein [Bacilli bacterium]
MRKRIVLIALMGALGISAIAGAALMGNGHSLSYDNLVDASGSSKSFTFDSSVTYQSTNPTTFKTYYYVAETAERSQIDFSVNYAILDASFSWYVGTSGDFVYCENVPEDNGAVIRVGLNGITSFTANFVCSGDVLDSLEYTLYDEDDLDIQSGDLQTIKTGVEVSNTSGKTARTLEIEYHPDEGGNDFSLTSLVVNWSC